MGENEGGKGGRAIQGRKEGVRGMEGGRGGRSEKGGRER